MEKDKGIVETVEELEKQGYDKETIKGKMRKLGFDDKEIDEVFKSVHSLEDKEKEHSNLVKFGAVAGIFLLIVVGMTLLVVLGVV